MTPLARSIKFAQCSAKLRKIDLVFLELLEFGALLYVIARMIIFALVFAVVGSVLLTCFIVRRGGTRKSGEKVK